MPKQSGSVPLSIWFWLVVLLLFTAAVGARGLNADALWYDEYWSLYYAGGAQYGPATLADTVQRVAGEFAHEKNPPGYYILLNLWGQFAGWSETGGRALSWLAGLLAAACTFRLAVDVTPALPRRSRWLVGLGAAAFIGGSAFVSDYLHEMRVYILSVWLAATVLWLYWRVQHARRAPSVRWQAALVITTAASLYLHYAGVIILGAVALYHLLAAPKNRRWWQVMLLLAAGGTLFLPWLPTLLDATQRAQNLRLTALDTSQTVEVLLYVLSNGSIALLALVGWYGLKPANHFALLLALGSVALGLALNAVYPFVNHIRYLLVLWPPLALVFGQGVERLARIGIRPAVVLAIWLGAGLWNSFNPAFVNDLPGTFPHQFWRELAAVLTERAQPGDVVAFHAGDFDWMQAPVMEHYLHGIPVESTLMEALPGLQANDEYAKEVRDFIGDTPRVWLGVNRLYPPNFRLAEFERALSADYVTCGTILNLPDMSLDLYTRMPLASTTVSLRFGDSIGLVPVEIIPAKNGLLVTLAWQVGANVPPNTYSVALHVVDSAGTLIAQTDYPLPNDHRSCRTTIIPVTAGSYTLRAVVYNWQMGERLPAVNTVTGETGDSLSLTGVNIP